MEHRQNGREHDQNFLNGKTPTDADAGTQTERNEGATGNIAILRRHEALGTEVLRIVPKPTMAVHDLWRNQNLRPLLDSAPGEVVATQSLAAHERRRRIQPQRLVDDGAGEDEVVECLPA